MGFLCKEQVIKGLYLAIGSKHNMPKDLLLIIYRLTKDDSEVREYHKDAVFRNTIPNYAGSAHLPLGRGLEWAIKWEKNKINKVRHTQIQVFGERDYLLKRVDYVPRRSWERLREDHLLQHFFKRSHNKLKLLYLNTSPMDEVLDDYLNYLESDREPEHRLIIDNFGEAIGYIQPGEIFIDS